MQSKIEALWETYYVKKPLTFWEFVEKQTNLKNLFGCVEIALKTYDKEFQRNLTKTAEVYVSGAVGIGKGVYTYLIIAYRLYLSLLLKNPKKDIFSFAPSAELSCMFVGRHCDQKLKGFLHFLKGIQNEKDPIFVFSDKDTENVITIHNESGKCSAHFNENEIEFRTAKSTMGLFGTNPLVVDYEADLYETSTAMRLLEQIQGRMRSRFGGTKDLFTCLIVEKSPNNLYNDLLDQHIDKVENEYITLGQAESTFLVERFVPIYLKDVVYKIEDFDNYMSTHPKNDTKEFPQSTKIAKEADSLFDFKTALLDIWLWRIQKGL